LNCSVVLTVLV